MPILVFNFRKGGNIERAVLGERIGTLVQAAKDVEQVSAKGVSS